jgi:hypothetical protein
LEILFISDAFKFLDAVVPSILRKRGYEDHTQHNVGQTKLTWLARQVARFSRETGKDGFSQQLHLQTNVKTNLENDATTVKPFDVML